SDEAARQVVVPARLGRRGVRQEFPFPSGEPVTAKTPSPQRGEGTESGLAFVAMARGRALAAQLVHLAHDRLQRGLVGRLGLAAGRELALAQQCLERDPATSD